MASSKRLTLFDCVAIGINGIVGSGIFLLPGWVASNALAFSPLAYLACGALCSLVALCYAEVGGMYDRSGGTYLYARDAFGDSIGFGVGWFVLVSAIFGYATIARGFGEELARGLPSYYPAIFASGLVLLLGLANLIGLKTGARTSDALTLLKIVALVSFVVIGLFYVRGSTIAALGKPSPKGFAEGMFSALFTLSGFEFVAVIAGDAENPRRTIPLAIVGSLLGAVIIYALIQLVIIGVLPSMANINVPAPMTSAAKVFGGPIAASAVRIASLISMIGFCSGSALVGPRLIASLARDGVLPNKMAMLHPVRGNPTLAIALLTILTMVAVAFLGFKDLADLTIITLFAQYVPTCMAVIIFRRWKPDAPRQFRLPFGVAIPVAALGMMALIIDRIELRPLITAGIILAVGILFIRITRSSWAKSSFNQASSDISYKP